MNIIAWDAHRLETLKDLDKTSQNCAEKSNIIFKKDNKDPNIKNVIIHAYWSFYFNKDRSYVCNSSIDLEIKKELLELVKNQKKIFIILGVPEMNMGPENILLEDNYHNKKILRK